MNAFHPATPRMAFGIAAVALSVLTLGLTVIAPAGLDSAAPDVRAVAAPAVYTRATIVPSRIDVIGVRTRDVAAAPAAAPGVGCPAQG